MTNMNYMKSVCFVYWDPHPIHKAWAQSVNARFYSFVPFNSKIIKSNGILLHICAFLKALFLLPIADVYLMESPMMIPQILCRTLFSRKKIIAINSDPFLWALPKFNVLVRKTFKLLIRRINGYISTSEMMDSFAEKTNKKHEIVDLFVNSEYLKTNADLSSKNICFIGPHLNKNKGVDILVDVFSKLPDKDQRKLYLIGYVYDSRIKTKIKNISGLRRNVIMTGRVPDPAMYLKKCGLYLNLARFEPAGINIIESMATGIPPIVSNMCGFSSIVKKISPNLVVNLNEKNEKSILSAIHWLEHSGKKKMLGKKAKLIARKYTKQHSISDFKEKFQKLIVNA